MQNQNQQNEDLQQQKTLINNLQHRKRHNHKSRDHTKHRKVKKKKRKHKRPTSDHINHKLENTTINSINQNMSEQSQKFQQENYAKQGLQMAGTVNAGELLDVDVSDYKYYIIAPEKQISNENSYEVSTPVLQTDYETGEFKFNKNWLSNGNNEERSGVFFQTTTLSPTSTTFSQTSTSSTLSPTRNTQTEDVIDSIDNLLDNLLEANSGQRQARLDNIRHGYPGK